MKNPDLQTIQKIEELLPTIPTSNRLRWYVAERLKNSKLSYEPPHITIVADGKRVGIFYGVDFVTDKKKKAWQLGSLYAFFISAFLLISLTIVFLGIGITLGESIITAFSVAAISFVAAFVIGYIMGRFTETLETNQDYSIRNANDFLDTYIKHGNWITTTGFYGGNYYYSQSYFDRVSGRLAIIDIGLEGLIKLSWKKIRSISTEGSNVTIIKKVVLPVIADLVGAEKILLRFKNQDEATLFVDIVKQYRH